MRRCIESLESRCLLASANFAVIGDFGDAGPDEKDVADRVKSWNPEFIVTVGDNNYEDGAASTIDANVGQYYHSFIGNYSGSYGSGADSNRFFPVLGNHDWGNNAQPYKDYFTLPGNERYYDFVRGPVHFFALDSDPSEPDGITSTSTQGQWLHSKLATSTSPWNVVSLHHSPFSSGANHGSHPDLQWPFKQWGVDAVLAGHDHVYERILKDGVTYFVDGLGGRPGTHNFRSTPVSGSQFRYNGDHGAMRVNATDTSMTFEFIRHDGTLIDSQTLNKTPDPVPPPLPTVTVTAADRVAVEGGSDTARFKVTRTGSTTSDLKVRYSMGGVAIDGVDYASLSGWVTIKRGRSAANVYVTPIDDLQAEPTESVRIRLADKPYYSVPSIGRGAAANVFDNDAAASSAFHPRSISIGVSKPFSPFSSSRPIGFDLLDEFDVLL